MSGHLGWCHLNEVCQTSPTESCHISRLFSVFLLAKVAYFYWPTDLYFKYWPSFICEKKMKHEEVFTIE